MGMTTWLGNESSSPGSGYVLWAVIILVPLIVGRWWVVAALAGQVIALVALQLTGHMFRGLDGHEGSLDALSIVGLVFSALFMLILVGIRKAFDLWRNRGATASS